MKVVNHLTDVTSYGVEPNEDVVKLLEEALIRARNGQLVFTMVLCGNADDSIEYDMAGFGPSRYAVLGALEWAKSDFINDQQYAYAAELGEGDL